LANKSQRLKAKITLARDNLKHGKSQSHDQDDVMERVLNRLQTKAALQTVAA
jgi:hypothetical protein